MAAPIFNFVLTTLTQHAALRALIKSTMIVSILLTEVFIDVSI